MPETDLSWWALILGIAEVGLLLLAVIWALTKTADRPHPTLLIVALSLITLVILVVYVITDSSDILTIAGVPIGALVSATTGAFTVTNKTSEAVVVEPTTHSEQVVIEPEEYEERDRG